MAVHLCTSKETYVSSVVIMDVYTAINSTVRQWSSIRKIIKYRSGLVTHPNYRVLKCANLIIQLT